MTPNDLLAAALDPLAAYDAARGTYVCPVMTPGLESVSQASGTTNPGKLGKALVMKGHKIAKAVIREGGASKVREPYAVGMAAAMGTAKRRKKK